MYDKNDGAKIDTDVRESVASKILSNIAQMAEYTSNLSNKVDIKLAPIMYERTEGKAPDDDKQEEYPALFNEMRIMLDNIARSLQDIDSSINRVEL